MYKFFTSWYPFFLEYLPYLEIDLIEKLSSTKHPYKAKLKNLSNIFKHCKGKYLYAYFESFILNIL